jgi:triosephosphate isomerase
VIAGNWKMFKTQEETRDFFDDLEPLVANSSHCDIVICPPFTSIPAAVAAARTTHVYIGAQDVHWEKQGAFTGEVAAAMLVESGCKYVIIGHSERRQFFAETDGTVYKKIKSALEHELAPIVCVGELLAEREGGKTEEVLRRQFTGAFAALTAEEFQRIIIAYEPVWAIGTGRTATPEMAAEAHRFLRQLAGEHFTREAAAALRILYGGSVKPDNIKGLMAQVEIDGALVGGASLEAQAFASIVNF